MKINGEHQHTIWLSEDSKSVIMLDQRYLPHEIKTYEVNHPRKMAPAIGGMVVRGAPLIGVAAAYGMYLGCVDAAYHNDPRIIESTASDLKSSRPTAVNLAWAVDKVLKGIESHDLQDKPDVALRIANQIKEDDIAQCEAIGDYGVELIREIHNKTDATVHILTHCNAGWLAAVDWGTALAPIYKAQEEGIPVHVWVDETRPRNQGANLTCFELGQQGIQHTLITDNTGGYLMQEGFVDMVIVGSDRTASNGDVANKIGTYLKALAAKDNNIPFYVALPSSTIDFNIPDGSHIEIEQRSEGEVRMVRGKFEGKLISSLICPDATPCANYGFDVTPARLVTGLITERGVIEANGHQIFQQFPDKHA